MDLLEPIKFLFLRSHLISPPMHNIYKSVVKIQNSMKHVIARFWIQNFWNFFLLLAGYVFGSYSLIIATEKLLVLLRDGRKLLGILRSFDQFGTPVTNYLVKGYTCHQFFNDRKCHIRLCSQRRDWGSMWKGYCGRSLLRHSFGPLHNSWRKRCFNWRAGMTGS